MTVLNTYWSVDVDRFLGWIGRVPAPMSGPAADAEKSELPLQVVNGVAVIPVMGVLEKRPNWISDFFGDTTYFAVGRAIQAAAADREVEKILLRIDSPGGTVDGLSDLGDTIRQVREKKPVIAQVEGLAASAAYYLASQATKIYASRTDLIGSIGTYMAVYDWSAMFAKEGVKPVVITSGKHKAAGFPGTEITDEQKAEFQRIVDFYFEDFLTAVSRGRGVAKSVVKAAADGRVFPAEEAKSMGLIDGIRTMDETTSVLMGRQNRKSRAKVLLMSQEFNR